MSPKEKSRFDILYQNLLRTLKRHGKADKTIEAYARGVRRLAEFTGRCPDKLSNEQLNTYFDWLIAHRGWSTVKVDRNGIRFFHEEVLGRDMPWVDMVKPPKVRALPDLLTVAELAAICACTQERRFRTFWLTTYSMGLRLGETLNLMVGDIDAERMRVHVRRAKGNKDRFVVLPELTLVALRRLWSVHRHPRLLFPAKPGPRGGQPVKAMDRATTQRAFSLAVSAARIHKKVSIHSLRHSYATHLIEAGLSLTGVQDQLGHADPRTTARYVQMTDKSRDDQVALINQLVASLAQHLRRQPRRV